MQARKSIIQFWQRLLLGVWLRHAAPCCCGCCISSIRQQTRATRAQDKIAKALRGAGFYRASARGRELYVSRVPQMQTTWRAWDYVRELKVRDPQGRSARFVESVGCRLGRRT